ncbi:hypothetical protein OAS19_02140 [Altererythrobacter sp.]|nr:hypothetical protein [Altererythrobacter sp.]
MPDDVGGQTPSSLDAMAIAQAMSAVPAPQRLAANLYLITGPTLSEISEAKSVPLGAAKSRLSMLAAT